MPIFPTQEQWAQRERMRDWLIERYREQRAAVYQLHRPVERRPTGKWWPLRLLLPFGQREVCEHCTITLTGGEHLVLYPCPTIRAIDGEPTPIPGRDV